MPRKIYNAKIDNASFLPIVDQNLSFDLRPFVSLDWRRTAGSLHRAFMPSWPSNPSCLM